VQWGYKARLVEWLQTAAPTPIEERPRWRAVDLTKRLPPGLHKQIPYGSGEPSGRDASHPAPGILQHPTLQGGPPHRRTLDAWLPSDHRRPAPAVVLLHGGGWEAGDRVTYITPLFEPLARAGLAWFSVDYRLTPSVQHPEQLDDARAAVAFVKQHAEVFGVDPRRLVLIGESASGQMVAMLASEDRTLAGVVSFYGVYDFLPMVTDAAPRSLARRLFGRSVLDDATREMLRKYSPLYQVRRETVPMLLIHGTNERLWEQGVTMAARLGELGVPHEFLRVDGAPHGMENWEGRPEWQSYKDRLVSWLRERFEATR
jgi:alpha-L-fucosidase 2